MVSTIPTITTTTSVLAARELAGAVYGTRNAGPIKETS
jgi:hypothetical protein